MAAINPELDAFKKLLTSKKGLPRKEKELIDQFSALLREKNTLKERLSLIDGKCADLEEANAMLEDKLANERTQREELTQSSLELSFTMETLNRDNECYKSERVVLKNEVEKLQDEAAVARTQATTYEKDFQQEKRDRETAHNLKEEIRMDCDKRVRAMEAQCEGLTKQNDELRQKVAKLQQSLDKKKRKDSKKKNSKKGEACLQEADSQKDDLHSEFEKRETAMKQQIQKLRNQCDAYSKRGGGPSGGAGEACQQCPYRQQQLQALEGQNQHLERELDRARLELDQLYELRNNQKEVEARAYQLEQELAQLKQRKDVLQELSKGVTVTPTVGRGNGQPDTQLLAQLPFPVYKVAPGQQLPRQAQAATFPRNYPPNYGDSEGPPPLRPEDPPHMQSHSEGGVPNSLLRSQHHGGAQYQQPSQYSPELLPATVREEEFKTAGYLRSAAQENSTRVPLSRSQSAFPLHSQDTDTDLEELYEPYAAGKDPQSRERPLSQDDQVHHSYFQAPGNLPPHSPPSVLRHSDHGSPRVRSSATLPHLPQNGYSDSRASCANDNKLERPLSQEDQVHHGYQGIDSRTRGRANSSAAALCDWSIPQALFEGSERHFGYSGTASNESARFSSYGFDTGSQAFRTSTLPIPSRETPPPFPQSTNLPIPPRNIPPVPPRKNPATLPRSIPRVPPREHPATLPRNTPFTLPSDAPPVPPRVPIGHKPIACSIDPSSQTRGSNSPELSEQSELPFFLGSSEPGSSSPALSHLAFDIYEDSSASPHASPQSSVHRHDAIYETTQSHDTSDLLPGGAARAGEASGTSGPVFLDQKDQLPSQFDQQLPHKSFPRFTKRYEIPETLPPIAKSRNLASTKDSKAASPQSEKQTSSIPIPLSQKWQVLSPSCQSVSTVSPKPKPRSKLARTQSDAALLKRSLPTAGFRTPDYEESLPTHERKVKESVLEVGLTGEIAEMNETSDSRKQQTNDQTPFDSNLTCPVCGKMFRVFETLKCGSHVRKCQEKHEEKKQWNERVRGSSRGFSPDQSEHEVSDPRQVNTSTDPQCDVLKSNDPRPIPKKRNKFNF